MSSAFAGDGTVEGPALKEAIVASVGPVSVEDKSVVQLGRNFQTRSWYEPQIDANRFGLPAGGYPSLHPGVARQQAENLRSAGALGEREGDRPGRRRSRFEVGPIERPYLHVLERHQEAVHFAIVGTGDGDFHLVVL